MKYKKGDKVVVKVDKVGCNMTGNQLLIFDPANDVGLSADSELVLGKLEDFQPAEKKIKFSEAEKREFDELYPDTLQDVSDFLNDIYNFPDDYPNLKKRLYSNDRTNNFHSQIEFVKALEKPSLIEVVKEKKYYVHLLENDSKGYLNYNMSTKKYFTGSKEELAFCKTSYSKGEFAFCKTKFTKSKIEKMHFDNFKITNKALEEVEDD